MKRSIASRFHPVAFFLGAVAIAGAAAWLLRRSGPAPGLVDRAITAPPAVSEAWEDLPPSSFSFEADLESDEPVDARPVGRNAGFHSPDDRDALSPEELGAAFLAGATDTALDEPPSSTSEIAGFRMYHRAALADEASDSDNDEPVDATDERG
jgi:hypothetical protein